MLTEKSFTRVNNDVYGNPRYVCHYLNFVKDGEGYKEALKRANKIGGRKFNNKQYGGGIVFQSYNLEEDIKQIREMLLAEGVIQSLNLLADTLENSGMDITKSECILEALQKYRQNEWIYENSENFGLFFKLYDLGLCSKKQVPVRVNGLYERTDVYYLFNYDLEY